jgi:signal transduction histidine kinase
MDLYTGNEYIILFLVYGLAFFAMGISAFLQDRRRYSNFTILNAIGYLGYFGIFHGVTEWILMIYIANFYPDQRMVIYLAGMVLNAISFFFLFLFGLKSLDEEKLAKSMVRVPYVILAVWTAGLVFVFVRTGFNADPLYSIMSAFSRYFIGFPAAVVTFVALRRSSDKIRKIGLVSIADGFRRLGLLFLTYGVLAGLVVRKTPLFPSNVVNNELFMRVFLMPVELVRAVAAVMITLLFTQVLELFSWENNKNIERLIEERAISLERKKMAQEIHDNVIQNLFATGLRLENLIEKETDETDRKDLLEIKSGLNANIVILREFIGIIKKSRVSLDDLQTMLQEVTERFSRSHEGVRITMDYEVPEVTIGHISNQAVTQLYYIVQEALGNAVKHAEAKHVHIGIRAVIEGIEATVADDGKGFDLYDTMVHAEGYGLSSMQERARSVKGHMEIKTGNKGTLLEVRIPWEVRNHEG